MPLLTSAGISYKSLYRLSCRLHTKVLLLRVRGALLFKLDFGGVLLSQGLAPLVPSALEGLTSVFGMGTGDPLRYSHRKFLPYAICSFKTVRRIIFCRLSPRFISTGRLKTLPPLHLRPINQVFFLESYFLDGMGDLILEEASRLDAFSAYPFRT